MVVEQSRGIGDVYVCFFFFKQKTAYEIMPSLVGSEMCIRDRYCKLQITKEYCHGVLPGEFHVWTATFAKR